MQVADKVKINMPFIITRAWPYRTAMIRDIFLRIPSCEMTKKLEEDFGKALGGMLDNHTCFEITNRINDYKVYARYSDNEITFGLSIEEGRF